MATKSGLTKMPYAQASVRYENGSVILKSYDTDVAAIVTIANNPWVVIFGLHSMTTRRHISAFVSEYAGVDYATAKAAYEGGYVFNANNLREIMNMDMFVARYFFASHMQTSARGFNVYAR